MFSSWPDITLNLSNVNNILFFNQMLSCMLRAQFRHIKTDNHEDNLGTKWAHPLSETSVH